MSASIVRRVLLAAAALSLATVAQAASAIRVEDRTSHGGSVLPPGSPNVFIEGRPAVRLNDQVACPLFNGVVPHVGGPIATGSGSVFINGRPAARAGSVVTEVEATSVLTGGSETVQIGN
jgi:uncharacterized Zn-binding protein involved in type VI secretion